MKKYSRIKQLTCKHEYLPWANVHGDFIHYMGGVRTVLYCPKCGKRKYIKEYIEAPIHYNYLWNYLAAWKYDGKEFADKNFKDGIFKDVELYIKLYGGKEEEK